MSHIQLEPLESRLLLSASSFPSIHPQIPPISLHDGILTIRGGPGNDRISFSAKFPRDRSPGDFLVKVHLNHQTRWFHRSRIQRVHIDTGAGDDWIMLRPPPDPCESVPGQPVPVQSQRDDDIDGPCIVLIIVGPAKITAGPGNDTIYGSDLPDTIDAGAGNDLIYGMGGSDHIFAKAGDDTIHGDHSPDHISGGSGATIPSAPRFA